MVILEPHIESQPFPCTCAAFPFAPPPSLCALPAPSKVTRPPPSTVARGFRLAHPPSCRLTIDAGQDWRGSRGRPHKLVLSAPLAASPRPATTSADLRGAPRGATREGSSTRSPALPHSARGISSGIRPSTTMTPRRSRGSSNPSAFLEADRIHEEELSSSSFPRRHASATTASPRSRATTRAGGAGGGGTSTSPSGGKHIILGQLQRRTFRSYDEDGVEVQLSIGGVLDSSAGGEVRKFSP